MDQGDPDQPLAAEAPLFAGLQRPAPDPERSLEPVALPAARERVDPALRRQARQHALRLEGMGLAIPLQRPLVRRNEVDGGLAMWIPAGAFAMGTARGEPDERPVRQVELAGFYMDVYPITVGQFGRFAQQTGLGGRDRPAAEARLPVVGVSWDEACSYARWAGKRLPSEAEWEKAARGIDARPYPWGEDFEPDRVHLLGRGYADRAPVGRYPSGASPYGIQDMIGNVWEWVADPYDPKAYAVSGPARASGQRVVRGGSWVCHPRLLRCARRDRRPPAAASRFVGFRCAG